MESTDRARVEAERPDDAAKLRPDDAAERPDDADAVRAAWSRLLPGVDTEPVEIVFRVLRAARLIERHSDRQLAAAGLTRPELELLMLLRRSDAALSPTAIADALLFTAPATTKRLSALEARGLLSRVVNPDDRRGSLVTLTESGRRLVERVLPEQLALEAELLGGLSPAERSRIAAALRTLLAAVSPSTPVE
ncbi:MarR family winged helix-turn-helix transcriptional regulator [Gryllotalpicola ginsengisoli]|uniref:MarR family winged helix-turn-helix transcriptional regulator n=1 Tax=Gryllotalpicola ginsengisoli TaxID=444608 RepID=UPI0003B34D63|nr:MarR family transcriptional regulator [Gryllotalpicola ginsengisoli]